MPMNFLDDYGPELLTGTKLHDLLHEEGKAELVLAIASVRPQPFPERPEWVLALSSGADEYELRLKKQNGRILAEAFGNDGENWIGRQIVLTVEWREWTNAGGQPVAGHVIHVKPLEPTAIAPLPRSRDLDDEIPF